MTLDDKTISGMTRQQLIDLVRKQHNLLVRVIAHDDFDCDSCDALENDIIALVVEPDPALVEALKNRAEKV